MFSNVYFRYEPMDNLPKLVNIKKAAEMLGVTALTLRNWDKAGKLTPLRHPLNNYRVYRRDDIEALLAKINTNTQSDKRPYGKKIRKLSVKHTEE